MMQREERSAGAVACPPRDAAAATAAAMDGHKKEEIISLVKQQLMFRSKYGGGLVGVGVGGVTLRDEVTDVTLPRGYRRNKAAPCVFFVLFFFPRVSEKPCALVPCVRFIMTQTILCKTVKRRRIYR